MNDQSNTPIPSVTTLGVFVHLRDALIDATAYTADAADPTTFRSLVQSALDAATKNMADGWELRARLDRYSMGYDSDIFCETCQVEVEWVTALPGPWLPALLDAAERHEVEVHHGSGDW